MTPAIRYLVPWLVGTLAACLVHAGCVGADTSEGGGKAIQLGKLVVAVRTPSQATVESIMVYVQDETGHVDSSVTDTSGLVTFGRVPAGRVMVRTADKSWLRRRKGTLVGRGADTVMVLRGQTTRHAVLVEKLLRAYYR